MWNDIISLGLDNIQKEKKGLFVVENILVNPFGYVIVTLSNNEKWCIDSKGNVKKRNTK